MGWKLAFFYFVIIQFGMPIAYQETGQRLGHMMKTNVSNPTIFLVEDDLDDQQLLLEAFSQITDMHHLRVLSNGRILVDLLANMDDRELPCLIVLDYNMPELNGKQTLQILQKFPRYHDIPKVVFSTSNSARDREECMFFGAMDFIIKPSSILEIVDSAKQMLDYCEQPARFMPQA
jgi:CheY-like chemotaxis protein